MKDDFSLENPNFDFDDEDDDWGEDESTWTADDDAEGEEAPDVKDESTAYLEFLNEEVRFFPCRHAMVAVLHLASALSKG